MVNLFLLLALLASSFLQSLGPILPAVCGLALLWIPVSVLYNRAAPKIWIWLTVFLLMTLASGFASGGVNLASLTNVQFFSTDGRVFFYYIPLLLGLSGRVPNNAIAITRWVLIGLSIFTLVLFAVWVVGIQKELLGGARFSGLINHKTSAGTAFFSVAVVLIYLGMKRRDHISLALGYAMVIPGVCSTSRQALLGVVAVLLYLMTLVRFQVRVLLVIGVIVVGTIGGLLGGEQGMERIQRVFSTSTIDAIQAQWRMNGWRPVRSEEDDANKDLAQQLDLTAGGEWNLVGRILFYKRAVELFQESPTVGVGFGRYNDPIDGYIPEKGRGFFALAVGSHNNYLEKNAHNSYLHLLAEQGILGLGVCLYIWFLIWRTLRRKGNNQVNDRAMIFIHASLLPIAMLPLSSLLGHALAAPQVGIPITTCAAIALALRTEEYDDDEGEYEDEDGEEYDEEDEYEDDEQE